MSDPVLTFNPLFPLCPSSYPRPPGPFSLSPQHVLRLWFRSGNDQRLSYVQGLQA